MLYKMVDAIDSKHISLCTKIEQNISEVLLARGDCALIGELDILKDRLNVVWKEAGWLTRSSANQPTGHASEPVPGITQESRENNQESDRHNLDNVFVDVPVFSDDRLSKTLLL